jgi:fructoselysine 3-epimerase
MKSSLSSFVYFNYSLADAIRLTKAAGFQGIDIWGGRPHAFRRDLGPDELQMLKSLLKSEELAVASFIPAQFRYPTCLCSGNETIRRDSVAYIQDSIYTASALGAPVVSVCPGHSLHGQTLENARECLCTSLDTICHAADNYGIKIALEPADRYETDLAQTTGQALALIKAVNCPNLGVVLDNGHAAVVGESPADAVRSLGHYLYHVHVDDNNGLRDQHLVPGDGSLEFGSFLAALREVNYTGFLCAELTWDYTVDPDAPVRKTSAVMAEWLKA